MSRLTEFYLGLCPSPAGDEYEDIVHHWSNERWESNHQFIQWLFPLRTPSNFNPDAPLLADEDVALFRSNPELRNRLFLAFRRFCLFLGLAARVPTFHDENDPTGPIEFFWASELKGWVSTVWKQPNHNWLRITRVLASLNLLGLECVAKRFFDEVLCRVYDENREVSPETFEYWVRAARGEIN